MPYIEERSDVLCDIRSEALELPLQLIREKAPICLR